MDEWFDRLEIKKTMYGVILMSIYSAHFCYKVLIVYASRGNLKPGFDPDHLGNSSMSR